MTKSPEKSVTRSNYIQKPAFSIVYIAYGEVNAMSGAKDQSAPCSRDVSNEGAGRIIKEYECVGRIARIPLIESTGLFMSNLYASVKKSHCVVHTMFDNVEEGWSKGAEIVGPLSSKIEETLERPLRAIDSAACAGLDYVEENIPSVKLPPEEMYEKSKDYLAHRVLAPALKFTCTMLENFREKVSQYAKSEVTAEAVEKDTENHGNNEIAKNQK